MGIVPPVLAAVEFCRPSEFHRPWHETAPHFSAHLNFVRKPIGFAKCNATVLGRAKRDGFSGHPVMVLAQSLK